MPSRIPNLAPALLLGLLAGALPPTLSAVEPPAVAGSAATPAPTTANRDVVRRYIDEVLSQGNLDRLEQLIAPGYVDSSPGADERGAGPERVRIAQRRVRALFSRIAYRVDHLIAEEDKVVARYTVRATYQPTDPTRPGPAGTEVWITGMTIFRLADGRIEETWTINDQLEMFRQLGYKLEPPKAPSPAPASPGGRP
jgi:predicted ester cyclase